MLFIFNVTEEKTNEQKKFVEMQTQKTKHTSHRRPVYGPSIVFVSHLF